MCALDAGFRADLPPLYLIGGGGHALVVAETAQLAGYRLAGYFDDRAASEFAAMCPRQGTIRDALRGPNRTPVVLALGDLTIRKSIIHHLTGPLATVVHPSAVVSPSAVIGPGTFVAAGVVVNGGVRIGAHAIINSRAVVEHNCLLGENVHVGPGAVLGGGVHLGNHVLIGIHASVKPHTTVGDNCVVGAGAVVLRNVGNDCLAVGVPARLSNRISSNVPYPPLSPQSHGSLSESTRRAS